MLLCIGENKMPKKSRTTDHRSKYNINGCFCLKNNRVTIIQCHIDKKT